jgi:hypothetical protein
MVLKDSIEGYMRSKKNQKKKNRSAHRVQPLELYQRQWTGSGQKQRSCHHDRSTVKETKQDRLEVNALATGNNDRYLSLTTTDWETDCLSQTLFEQGG